MTKDTLLLLMNQSPVANFDNILLVVVPVLDIDREHGQILSVGNWPNGCNFIPAN